LSYYEWKPYVPVAARRKQAEKLAAKAAKAGAALMPVGASRGAIAKTFWGKAWCDNLERYSDYANRLPRGRTYLRNGSVIDLRIGAGEVRAQVVGSSLYQVTIGVAAVPPAQWRAIGAECSTSIDSLVELLQGRLSTGVMQCICKPGTGLFPTPREIKLDCSCPDWAEMCKHVAAVLYGVGARLDQQPELLFQLRRVDAKDLVASAGAGLGRTGKGPAAGKVLADAQLADVFGIEIDAEAPAGQRAAPDPAAAREQRKVPVKKVPLKPVPVRKPAVKKVAVEQVPVKRVPVKVAPVKKIPVKTAPVRTAPVKKSPVEKAPVKTAPAKKAPAVGVAVAARRIAAAKPGSATAPGKAAPPKRKAPAGKAASAKAKSSAAVSGLSGKKKPPASRRG